MTSNLEQEARKAWLAGADFRFGVCGSCGRHRTDEDKPLLVARRSRRRPFECLECHDLGAPKGPVG